MFITERIYHDRTTGFPSSYNEKMSDASGPSEVQVQVQANANKLNVRRGKTRVYNRTIKSYADSQDDDASRRGVLKV